MTLPLTYATERLMEALQSARGRGRVSPATSMRVLREFAKREDTIGERARDFLGPRAIAGITGEDRSEKDVARIVRQEDRE